MPSRYKHNYRAFGNEVLRSPFMVAEMGARAQRVVRAAEADAAGFVDTGDYIDAFKASAHVGKPSDGKTRRAIGVAENTSDHALLVEFKDGHHTLARALDAAD